MNKIAWLGQASVSVYGNIPEDITRIAWSYLTLEIQERSNKINNYKKMSTTYLDKKIKCKISGIANKNKMYNITIAAYTYNSKSKRFLEWEVIIP